MSQQNDVFPRGTLSEALPHLRRPMTPEAVHFKPQSEFPGGALVVPYIDARLVYERLNLVVADGWSCTFEPLSEALWPEPELDRNGQARPVARYVVCRLTVCGVTREDVGEGADPKAAYSDAIKRAAVPFGIGRFLYAMGSPTLYEGGADNELRRSRGRNARLVVDRRTERWLRDHYAEWLAERSGREFGEALGHGDDPEAVPPDAQGSRSAGELAPPAEGAAAPDGEGQPEPEGDPPEPGQGAKVISLPERQRAGYSEEAVGRLSAFLSNTEPNHRELRDTLETARAGEVTERQLGEAIARAEGREDREEARWSVRRWLAKRVARRGGGEPQEAA
jgi:hypothetical protein